MLASKLILGLRGVLGLVIVFALIYLVRLSDAPAARYTKNLSCHYDVIFKQSGKPSIVTIGTSRTLRAISGVAGGVKASELLGEDIVWLDLARSWRGRGQMYRQVSDIIKNRDVEVLAVEYFPDSRYYGHYAKTVKSSDIIEDVFISRSGNAYNRTAFAMRSLALKYSGFLTKPSFNDNPVLETDKPASISVDCIKGESGLVPAKLNAWLSDNPEPNTSPKPLWDFDLKDERRNSGYIEKIIKTADDADVPVVFFYVPLLNEGIVSDEAKDQFSARFGAPLLSMDVNEARALYETPDNYGDSTHMRNNGRVNYTHWLAGKLAKKIDARAAR